MSLKHIVILLICTGLAAGCGSVSQYAYNKKTPQRTDSFRTAHPGKIAEVVPDLVRDRLYEQYQEWQGTPYRLGGATQTGIDCSALVQNVFRSEFGLQLPRTARQQAQSGKNINRSDLIPGDLVFFRTGHHTWHVGIYLEDKKFFHASSSKGVTISRLDNVYWKAKYWKSIRI